MSVQSSVTPRDDRFVNVMDPQEVRYWTERLRCTPSALREAVDEVGPSVAAVEEFLSEGEA